MTSKQSEINVSAPNSAGMAELVSKSSEVRWAIQTPLPQKEDRLPMETAVAKWQKIYDAFGAKGEKERDEVFAAVVLYFCVNGCSPSGNYSRTIKTAGGVSAPVASVVKIVGRLDGEIRQFLRGRMKDAFEALKYSPTIKNDEALKDKAESKGVPRDMAYLLADFLKDCEYFNPTEQALYSKLSVRTIAEANARYASAGRNHNLRVDEIVVADTVEQQSVDTGMVRANPLGVGTSRY